MKTLRGFLNEDHFEYIKTNPYLYHTSPKENHENIKTHGLTSQSGVAKNGNNYKLDINFSTNKKESKGYAKDGNLYRVKYNHLKEPSHDPIAGYVRTQHDVHSRHIEHHENGKWKKLNEFVNETVHIKLRSLDKKSFTHEPTRSRGELFGNYITGIETPEEHRGKGGAHAVMKQITKHLDDHNITGKLSAYPLDHKTNAKMLVSFYQRHGFKRTGVADFMERKPRK